MLREHRPGVAVVKPTFIDGGPDTQTIPNFDFMSPHMIESRLSWPAMTQNWPTATLGVERGPREAAGRK